MTAHNKSREREIRSWQCHLKLASELSCWAHFLSDTYMYITILCRAIIDPSDTTDLQSDSTN